MSIIEKSACELIEMLGNREISSREVTAAFCDRIEAVDSRVRAFLHYDRDQALRRADEIDHRRSAGQEVGLLAGVPVAIKDILCARGEPTTCGSKMLEHFKAPYDAHVIERLDRAGAVRLGRVNMDEFAMGSSCENSAYQKTANPWDLRRVPGGSSGGSAACVAALEAPLSIGTDTGGSIRQPASLCGIVGLKPTYGRVSRFGLVAYASSLDQIGPMARSVVDAALLLEAIAGHDPRDSTSLPHPVPPYRQSCQQPLPKLRVGVVTDYFGEGLDEEVAVAVKKAIEVYRSLGATIVDVRLPTSAHAIPTYYVVATAEASSNLARYDGVHYGHRAKEYRDLVDMYKRSRGEGFGHEVKRRIMLGTLALSAGRRDAFYNKALQVRRLLRGDYDAAFQQCDVVLGPTSPTAAFKLGEKSDDPLAMYLSDIYTVATNLAGLPGLSLPCGFTKSGLPIGLQLQGPAMAEETLLRAGYMYEQATDWHRQTAPLAGTS
ncbi:Asp-tRNA(Asn)/Glu-tRNA(Gln) amidotransferase subunit GatA [bacterium]|nr:Asp-tRNA(Asn)/Glu-tRNA(Gln) amidotransferase subunit GatA [bacterium]